MHKLFLPHRRCFRYRSGHLYPRRDVELDAELPIFRRNLALDGDFDTVALKPKSKLSVDSSSF